jgi:hypothetical protein
MPMSAKERTCRENTNKHAARYMPGYPYVPDGHKFTAPFSMKVRLLYRRTVADDGRSNSRLRNRDGASTWH